MDNPFCVGKYIQNVLLPSLFFSSKMVSPDCNALFPFVENCTLTGLAALLLPEKTCCFGTPDNTPPLWKEMEPTLFRFVVELEFFVFVISEIFCKTTPLGVIAD